MKTKILFSILTLGLVVSLFSQKATIDLTFTAENNGQYVPLDSIYVKNITQGEDTILYSPETLLSLEYITGVDEIDLSGNTFSISQNYPNPFSEKTSINLFIPKKEHIKIIVRDVLGRKLAFYDNALNEGNHSFTFHSGNETNYLLTVIGERNSITIKMLKAINNSLYGGKCTITYNGSNDNVNSFKSQEDINSFEFNIGDELQYTGYATTIDNITGSAIITDSPQTNTDYEFEIIKGIRCPGIPSIGDLDGNIYNTVQVGDQCWMAENLKTTTYQNNTPIPNITDMSEWYNLSTGAYVWYDNDISWKELYGGLYNWFTAIDPNGLCPTGWHVPTNDEWTILSDFIVAPNGNGNTLRSCRQVSSPLQGDCNTNDHPRWDENFQSNSGTDDYGFSALPGGKRSIDGPFESLGNYCNLWSSSEYSAITAWSHSIISFSTQFHELNNHERQKGFSVRCLKD